MTEIISRDIIKAQARRAAESDFRTGRTQPDCPYLLGSAFAKAWYAAYLERECELNDKPQVISTFAGGAVEQLEVVTV